MRKTATLSVVLPVFHESKHIIEAVRVIDQSARSAGDVETHFILVDDGSRDDSWTHILELKKNMSNLTAVRLSRNFGKEAAICAGLEHFKSDACIVMDADLQHPPELIPQFISKWRDEGYDIVGGVKERRAKESFLYRIFASIFYRIISRLSGLKLDQSSDYKLLDKRVVDAWRKLEERDVFFRGLIGWVGFRSCSIPFTVRERAQGQSGWSMFRLIQLAIGAVTAFSSLPLQIITVFGVGFSILAFALSLQTVYRWVQGTAVSGFATVIILILVIGSMLMLSLGIVGAYLAKIYNEVKRRPRYVVDEVR